MKNSWIVLAALVVCSSASAQMYKWVDKDGKVHYSDQAPPGVNAEPVQLKPLTTMDAPAPTSSDAADGTPPPAPTKPIDNATSYKSIVVTSPKKDETLRGGGAVSFAADTDPALAFGDSIIFELDGAVVSDSVGSLDRGSHQIVASVIASNGAVKISSAPLTFFVQQATVQQQQPPAPKKP